MDETVQISLQVSIIIILLILFIKNMMCNQNDNFNITPNHVPHINEIEHKQLNPLNKARNLPDDNSNSAPDFKMNDSEVKNMKYNSIYRQKTGRQAHELENFVSIYDSNFGGLIGTKMGLTR